MAPGGDAISFSNTQPPGPEKSKRNGDHLNQLTRRVGNVKLKAVSIDTIETFSGHARQGSGPARPSDWKCEFW